MYRFQINHQPPSVRILTSLTVSFLYHFFFPLLKIRLLTLLVFLLPSLASIPICMSIDEDSRFDFTSFWSLFFLGKALDNGLTDSSENTLGTVSSRLGTVEVGAIVSKALRFPTDLICRRTRNNAPHFFTFEQFWDWKFWFLLMDCPQFLKRIGGLERSVEWLGRKSASTYMSVFTGKTRSDFSCNDCYICLYYRS